MASSTSPTVYQKQSTELLASVSAHANANAAALCEQMNSAAVPLLVWVQYLLKYKATGTANSLLDALASAVRETAGCVALGLVRPTLFSLRGQIDLALAWLFYKDHPIEWAHVNETGKNFSLKSDLEDYLATYVPRFRERLKALRSVSKHGDIDPYRLLSAHVHGQSQSVLSTTANLKEMVGKKAQVAECVKAQAVVTEYLGDVLFCAYFKIVSSLPTSLVKEIDARFVSPEQKTWFYKLTV